MNNEITHASGFEIGDVVKVKRKDKTKSPYSYIQVVDHETKRLDLMPFDAPGSGNRKQRRARFATERKSK